MHIHESGYKRLFANRTFFRDLVQSFIEENWVERLDFERKEYRTREKLKSMIVEAILKREEVIRLKAEAEAMVVGIAKGKAEGNSNVDCTQA